MFIRSPLAVVGLVTCFVLGCSARDATSNPAPAQARCQIDRQSPAIAGNTHLVPCSEVDYPSLPPSSGAHYRAWAAFKSYSRPVPWGFLVHSLEHGAVVLSYNCPEGCDDEVARAQDLIDRQPLDESCPASVDRRIILAPAPDLPTRWAASAWGQTLTAGCFDETALAGFISAHYGRGPEDLCLDGVDRSSTGWCSAGDAGSDSGADTGGSDTGSRDAGIEVAP